MVKISIAHQGYVAFIKVDVVWMSGLALDIKQPQAGDQHGGVPAVFGVYLSEFTQELAFFEICPDDDVNRQAYIERQQVTGHDR